MKSGNFNINKYTTIQHVMAEFMKCFAIDKSHKGNICIYMFGVHYKKH